MTIPRLVEISSDSTSSFQDAIESGIKRAERTVKSAKGACVRERKLTVNDGKTASCSRRLRMGRAIVPGLPIK